MASRKRKSACCPRVRYDRCRCHRPMCVVAAGPGSERSHALPTPVLQSATSPAGVAPSITQYAGPTPHYPWLFTDTQTLYPSIIHVVMAILHRLLFVNFDLPLTPVPILQELTD
ncbi:hypothetical protein J6590_039998 [Homalodisca vitripennis]|nr:hypothetical protein J6590_039998 [Homalodisca vitripennis]